MQRRFHQDALNGRVHLLRNKVDLRALNQPPCTRDNLYRETLLHVRGEVGRDVDIGLKFFVFIHRGQQRGRGNVVADVYRNISDDARERRRQMVVGELALLGHARGRRRFPIRLGILKGLHGLVVALLAGHPSFEKLALTLHFHFVVFVGCLLLGFGAALLIDGRLLLQRINRHQHLSGADMVTRLDQNLGQRAIHLRLNTGRTARFYGRNVLVRPRQGG